MHPRQFLIDGIDQLGKSTLIKNIRDELGYYLVVHYEKPETLLCYAKDQGCRDPLKEYQLECNTQMFHMMEKGIKVIFDRTHLGEMVYAPLYRKYKGDYIYGMERANYTEDSRLILLITSDFNLCVDDGESFNFDNKVKEQQAFINAFCCSSISDKLIIDVHNGNGGFKTTDQILSEALKVD